MKQIPVASGLLLCDQVIVAEKTRDVTPVNCFSVRYVKSFPSEPFPFTLFALLADGLGEILLEVVIYRLDTYEEVHKVAAVGKFADPLAELRCTITIRNFSFPAPGHYQVSLLGDHELIAQRKFKIGQKVVP
jgi:hypothetical protein